MICLIKVYTKYKVSILTYILWFYIISIFYWVQYDSNVRRALFPLYFCVKRFIISVSIPWREPSFHPLYCFYSGSQCAYMSDDHLYLTAIQSYRKPKRWKEYNHAIYRSSNTGNRKCKVWFDRWLIPHRIQPTN